MSKQRPVLIVALGDTHCNSRLGLCPPEGVRYKEGGRYHPSPGQIWLYDKVYMTGWEKAKALRKANDARAICVINGDAADFHVKGQLIHANSLEMLEYVYHRVFEPVKQFGFNKTYVISGTPSHVGEEAEAEEALGRWLKAERDPDTESWTSFERFIRVFGVTFHFAHHGRVGGKYNTMQSHAANQAVDISHRFREAQYPEVDVAVRSHRHEASDSGDSLYRRTRYMVLPPLQLKTSFAYKVVPDNPPAYGMMFYLVRPDGTYNAIPHIVYPDPPKVETV